MHKVNAIEQIVNVISFGLLFLYSQVYLIWILFLVFFLLGKIAQTQTSRKNLFLTILGIYFALYLLCGVIYTKVLHYDVHDPDYIFDVLYWTLLAVKG